MFHLIKVNGLFMFEILVMISLVPTSIKVSLKHFKITPIPNDEIMLVFYKINLDNLERKLIVIELSVTKKR